MMMETTATQATNASTHSTNDPKAEHPADRVRIVSTPGICGGRPRIDGHRIQVEDVAIWHERMGMSPDEIVTHHRAPEVRFVAELLGETQSRSQERLYLCSYLS
jgi:uncharacterized protein (DUF433 family)